MSMNKLVIATSLALFATIPGHAGAMPVERPNLGSEISLIGDREKAAIGGAIVGGALGVMLGAAANRNAAPPPPAYARPAPPPEMEEVDEPEPVIVRPRRERRVVEVEDAVPEVVEEECVTRRSRIFDPRTGETVIRKERRCD
jgi:hypothetical protein